jgi:hypothetical protein
MRPSDCRTEAHGGTGRADDGGQARCSGWRGPVPGWSGRFSGRSRCGFSGFKSSRLSRCQTRRRGSTDAIL